MSTNNAGLLRGMPPPVKLCGSASRTSTPVDTPKTSLFVRTTIASNPNHTATANLCRDDTPYLSGLGMQSIHGAMHQSRWSGLCCFFSSPCLACQRTSPSLRTDKAPRPAHDVAGSDSPVLACDAAGKHPHQYLLLNDGGPAACIDRMHELSADRLIDTVATSAPKTTPLPLKRPRSASNTQPAPP